jgi:hypothetical protein
VDDYFEGPSGWLTFNQFFAREMRPGKRPIAAPRDDKVIVSPADAVFMGHWPITEDSNITLKGVNWAVADLLDSSPYKDAFKGGIYMHSFLYIDDYHRYHVPVGGTVKEIRNISGRVYLDVRRNPDGSLDVVDGDTYQFNQERGLIVIDSPEVGLKAMNSDSSFSVAPTSSSFSRTMAWCSMPILAGNISRARESASYDSRSYNIDDVPEIFDFTAARPLRRIATVPPAVPEIAPRR